MTYELDYHIMCLFLHLALLPVLCSLTMLPPSDPPGTTGPQLTPRNEGPVPMVEPRLAPLLDEGRARPTIIAQIPPPLSRGARPPGPLPPQVSPPSPHPLLS